MPSPRRQKSKARPATRKAPPDRKSAPKKAAPPKPAPAKKSATRPAAKASEETLPAPTPARRADGRLHVLSLAFVRDGDEFMARLETDGGQITELKNRSLDQLLTLVASELEDVLE